MRKAMRMMTALVAVIIMGVCPSAMALDGYDISNWQCGINTAGVPGDFVVVGATWGSGGINGTCLSNGVNMDANRQLSGAMSSGKRTGVYHYAMGGDPMREADFFVDNVQGYVRRSMLVLDWESADNPAWGDTSWPRRWAERVKARTGVSPVIYTMDSGYWQVAGMESTHDTGIWIAQYASMDTTGYQQSPWHDGMRGEVMRQYTSSGSLPGYGGRLDLDVFHGDAATWDRYADPSGAVHAPAPAAPAPQPAPSGDYVVRSGDCLSLVFGGDWPRVAAVNGLRPPYTIYPGQHLATDGTTSGRTVTVASGDTLSGIAARLGVSWTALHGYRSGDPALIYPGEVLTY